MNITILGSSSATPFLDRHPSSQLLIANDAHYLIDCGEGTIFRLNDFRIKKNKIKAIFISHLHGDHYYGLIGLLTTMSMHEKSDELVILSPPGLKKIIEIQCEISQTVIRFPIQYVEFSYSHQTIYSDQNIEVSTIPLIHKINTCGFIFHKKFPERKIIKESIEKYHLLPLEIASIFKEGFVMKDERKIFLEDISEKNLSKKTYAYCSDTRYDESYFPYIEDVDVLYHESTFMHKDIARAEYTKHSTAIEAANVARAVQANKLLIGHFSARYVDLEPMLLEAKSIFEQSFLAIEGLNFEI